MGICIGIGSSPTQGGTSSAFHNLAPYATPPHLVASGNLMKYTLFFIFTFSGFSGLIYESIWSHYLKLMLGHAAYAQTLVLAIFMGGMATGAWLTSRYSRRWNNLLLGYAITEGMIGCLGLIFHPLFTKLLDALYGSVRK